MKSSTRSAPAQTKRFAKTCAIWATGRPRNSSTYDRTQIFCGSNGSSVIDDARDQVASKIEDVMALLRKERSSLEKYGQILDRTSDGLQHNAINQEILIKIVSIMSTATDSTIEQGRQIANVDAEHVGGT
jgi:hypothetical protein